MTNKAPIGIHKVQKPATKLRKILRQFQGK